LADGLNHFGEVSRFEKVGKEIGEGPLVVDSTGMNITVNVDIGRWFVAGGGPPRQDQAIEKAAPQIGYREITHDANVAKVSIIGIGMRAHPGVAQTMFRTLSEKGINIQVISTSEIKVSVLIAEEYVELAVRALHSAYELDVA
jgi:aspartate kinase